MRANPMPRGWRWDETLFRGSAPHYARGRLPYPPGLADALADALALDGRGRLLDVGCGPGTVALRLAHLFEQIVGLDPDAGMLIEAERTAAEPEVANARWVRALAEHLPFRAGDFRVATFAQSFHWMERDRVAVAVRELLEPGGAFVQVSTEGASDAGPLPHPAPPRAAIQALVERYLGSVRRAGQGVLRYGTPGGEAAILARAGFDDPEVIPIGGGEIVVRTTDDLVAAQFSNSGSAPHLFGARLAAFEAELRAIFADASPAGIFAERSGEAELRVWRRPT